MGHLRFLRESGWRDAASWRNSAIADCRARANGAIAARKSGLSRLRWPYWLGTRLRPPQRFRDRNWSHYSLASGPMGSGPLLGMGCGRECLGERHRCQYADAFGRCSRNVLWGARQFR
jgi:hypothetical protein